MTRRLDPDARYGVRLTLVTVALLLVGVPFLLLALLVRGGWAPLRRLDSAAATGANDLARDQQWLVPLMEGISDVFDPWSFRAAAVVVGVLLLVRGRRRLAAWLLVTVLAGGLVVAALKEIVGRARPALPDPVSSAPGLSFPSGHAFGATVGALVALLLALPLLRGAWRAVGAAAAALVAVLTSASRVLLGVHYVSDVTAGAVLGLAWVAATTAVFETWRRETGRPPSPPTEGVDPEGSRSLAAPERR